MMDRARPRAHIKRANESERALPSLLAQQVHAEDLIEGEAAVLLVGERDEGALHALRVSLEFRRAPRAAPA